MGALIIALLAAAAILVALRLFGGSYDYLRQSYYRGVGLWASWLPVSATSLFVYVIGVNVSKDGFLLSPHLNLEGFLSNSELLVFFVLTPLFFTRVGNLVACALSFYSIERLLFSVTEGSSPVGVLMVLASTITIAILGDKMPWIAGRRANELAHRLREILIIMLSFAAVAAVISAMINMQPFAAWLAKYFQIQWSLVTIKVLLGGLFLAWVSIALGMTRHFILPLICLPSVCVLAFVTSWPNYILVVPFTASLALALAVIDQRLVVRA